MKKYILVQLMTVSLLSPFVCSAEKINSINWDLLRTQFIGTYCNVLTPTDITIDKQGHLSIDLSKLTSLKTILTNKNCTIKLPYTTELVSIFGKAQVTGHYHVPDKHQLLGSISVSKAGTTNKSEFFIGNNTDSEFLWQQDFSVSPSMGMNILKIVFSMNGIPKEITDDSKFQLSTHNCLTNEDCSSQSTPLKVSPHLLTIETFHSF